MSENILFEATFKVGDINKLKYDRVSRFEAICEARPDLQVFLDVNTELYPVEKDEILSIALALTLNIDGMKEEAKGWRAINRGDTTLADEYDYVCYGKIYRFDEGEGQNMYVNAVGVCNLS